MTAPALSLADLVTRGMNAIDGGSMSSLANLWPPITAPTSTATDPSQSAWPNDPALMPLAPGVRAVRDKTETLIEKLQWVSKGSAKDANHMRRQILRALELFLDDLGSR
jgi:hypothetical protein